MPPHHDGSTPEEVQGAERGDARVARRSLAQDLRKSQPRKHSGEEVLNAGPGTPQWTKGSRGEGREREGNEQQEGMGEARRCEENPKEEEGEVKSKRE